MPPSRRGAKNWTIQEWERLFKLHPPLGVRPAGAELDRLAAELGRSRDAVEWTWADANIYLRGAKSTASKRLIGYLDTSEPPGETDADKTTVTGTDWSSSELEMIVADYLDMFRNELDGVGYSKTEHRRSLAKALPGRSEGSIERKHQNISAVLAERGLRYIDGYKPLGNYLYALAVEVDRRLRGDEPIGARLVVPVSKSRVAGSSPSRERP